MSRNLVKTSPLSVIVDPERPETVARARELNERIEALAAEFSDINLLADTLDLDEFDDPARPGA